MKGSIFCLALLSLWIVPPAITQVDSAPAIEEADIRIELKALVTVKTGNQTRKYLCDIPKQTGMNVMLREFVAGEKGLINQLRFQREAGFKHAEEKTYPSLVLTPDVTEEKPQWMYHLENDTLCTLPSKIPNSPLADPAAMSKLLAQFDQ